MEAFLDRQHSNKLTFMARNIPHPVPKLVGFDSFAGVKSRKLEFAFSFSSAMQSNKNTIRRN